MSKKSSFYTSSTVATRGKYDHSDSVTELDEEDDKTAQTQLVIQQLLKEWEPKYCSFDTPTFLCATFNVNGKSPTQSLRPWLAQGITLPPDCYAVGFQELDVSNSAYVMDNPKKESEWVQAVIDGLHPDAQYIEVARIRLIGILLLVLCKSTIRAHVRSVHSRTVPTGLLGIMGNKGGVGVSLMLYDTRLCFVCSHLAAHTPEVDRRNQDFRDICNQLLFGPSHDQLSLFDMDAVVWLGDLNYRLDDLSLTDSRKYYAAKEYALMLERDQLKKQQRLKRAFHDFIEMDIKFAPTYKYDAGTDRLDSSEKQRPPAWTDRILHMAAGTSVETLTYESVMPVIISDHKPVRSLIKIKVKKVDTQKRVKYQGEALAEVDRQMNDLLPVLKLDSQDFDFGCAKFMQPNVRQLTLRNTGRSIASFRFKVLPGRNSPSQPWLIVMPEHRTVQVGEECTIHLQVLVDKECAWRWHEQLPQALDDMLVLHLRGGRDYFVAVHAVYEPSCFAQHMHKCLQPAAQATKYTEPSLIDLSANSDSIDGAMADGPVEPVPLPLWLLIEKMKEKYLDEPALFSEAGTASDFVLIRDWLDSGKHTAFPSGLARGAHSMAEAIERYLDCLPVTVVPEPLTNTFLAASVNAATSWKAVHTMLDETHRATFDYLIQFMRVVLDHSDKNNTNIQSLSAVFAAFMFRLDDVSTALFASAQRFLCNCIGEHGPPISNTDSASASSQAQGANWVTFD